jgi:hypothetical protein
MDESRWLLTVATVVMLRARSANLSVELVSSAQATDGDRVATIVVLQLPPSESCRRRMHARFSHSGAPGP